MRYKFLQIIIFIFFLPLLSFANHIVGGSLTYEQISNTNYRINLTLYRDCTDPGNQGFPQVVEILILKSDGSLYTKLGINLFNEKTLPPKIDTCVVKPGICIQEGSYTGILGGLPPSPNGYHIYYQFCCRTNSLLNIQNPYSSGAAFYAHIPGSNIALKNNSPYWNDIPQTFICQGEPISINYAAIDQDGDSLVYSLCTPFDSSKVTFPGGVFTAEPLKWVSTYSATNPFNATQPNSLTINQTGLITGGAALTSGNFVMGVRCEEYRNGIKLGEIYRDFQIKVIPCPPKIYANYDYKGNCSGLKVSFTSLSNGAGSFYWNFGDNATAADTSHAKNTSYTYPGFGKYRATFIINKGTPCVDSISKTIHISSVNAAFTSNTPNCQNTVINFTDLSTIDSSSVITNWNWNFGDGNTSSLQNPKNNYLSNGNYVTSLIVTGESGCKDTIRHTLSIQAQPKVNAGNDTVRCSNNPPLQLQGNVINAGGVIWQGGGSFSPSNTALNPVYTAANSAISKGYDTLLLISTNNALCPADTDKVVIAFSKAPTVNAGKDIVVCKDTAFIPLCATVSIASGVVWQTTGTGKFITDSTQLCVHYKPSTSDTAAGTVLLYATSTGNDNCSPVRDSILVTFTSTIQVYITYDDSVCTNRPIPLSATATSNAGIWASSGNGTFNPSTTTLSTSYLPSDTDNLNGYVRLFFTSTNNGDCQAKKDTIDITIIPSPAAKFSATSICAKKPVIFNDSSTSATDIVKWVWDFGDGTSPLETQNTTHSYATGGTYQVKLIVNSKNGCTDSTIKPLTIHYLPLADFTSMGKCEKDKVHFQDASTVSMSTIKKWKWEFGDGKTDTIQNTQHYFPSAGTYKTLLIVYSETGCIDTVIKTTTINKGPTAQFSSDAIYANVKQPVRFTDQSLNALRWLWHFNDLSADPTSTLQHPTHTYSESGHFDVCLEIADQNDCMDTLCKTEIIGLPVGVPNAFSPNEDRQNDILLVYGGPFLSFELAVFNNWGGLIFKTDKPSEGWDGKINGIDQPAGVYIYTVRCITEDGKEHKLSGDVTLIR